MSQTQTVLELNGRKITLIGTAHVSEESVKEVAAAIKEIKPDCVAIELDEKRCESIKNPEKFRELDLIKVFKNKQIWLMLANLVLSSFQKRMGTNVGVKPGDEMITAMQTAEELNIPCTMVDRPIQITFKRAWAKNNLWGKCKLISALLASALSKEEVSSQEIENLKSKSEMDSMMSDLSDFMPTVKQVLIDERDQYLASHIWDSPGNNLVAVLGAGHIPGVVSHLNNIATNKESTDTSEISSIPPKTIGSKILAWMIPVAIVALIVLGYVFGGKKIGNDMIKSWILWNSSLAAIGALIAWGHPLTILVSLIASPFTSLCPFIGVGFVSGFVQTLLCRPKVANLETLSDDVGKFTGWYKNRILRVFLVLILTTIGSSFGSWISLADIGVQITSLIGK